jgi:hypothetical protein
MGGGFQVVHFSSKDYALHSPPSGGCKDSAKRSGFGLRSRKEHLQEALMLLLSKTLI